MTYLVGLKRGRSACLIADTAVTRLRTGEVIPGAVKTGPLFPGCYYGLSGAAEAGREFIVTFKRSPSKASTLEEHWLEFVDYASRFKSDGRDFALLLLARHSGQSQLWTFCSRGGLVEHADSDMVTLGSGKGLLDAELKDFLATLGNNIEVSLRPSRRPPELVAGVLVSFWLTQRSQGDDFQMLEKNWVGGVFHFAVQDPDREYRQPPGVFALTRLDLSTRTIDGWLYRVAFAGEAMVVSSGGEEMTRCSIDEGAWPESGFMTDHERKMCFADARREALAMPFYDFIVVGAAERDLGDKVGIHFGRGNELGRNGEAGPIARQMFEAMYAASPKVPLGQLMIVGDT